MAAAPRWTQSARSAPAVPSPSSPPAEPVRGHWTPPGVGTVSLPSRARRRARPCPSCCDRGGRDPERDRGAPSLSGSSGRFSTCPWDSSRRTAASSTRRARRRSSPMWDGRSRVDPRGRRSRSSPSGVFRANRSLDPSRRAPRNRVGFLRRRTGSGPGSQSVAVGWRSMRGPSFSSMPPSTPSRKGRESEGRSTSQLPGPTI
jgi:hypothetical protein